MFWKCLSGQHLGSKAAQKRITDYYNDKSLIINPNSSNSAYLPSSLFTVLLLDEIDFLSTGDGSVYYSFFNWPRMRNARLAIVGVSNLMVFVERLSVRYVASTANHVDI